VNAGGVVDYVRAAEKPAVRGQRSRKGLLSGGPIVGSLGAGAAGDSGAGTGTGATGSALALGRGPVLRRRLGMMRSTSP
jgi:hypothetical protein